MTLSVCVFCGSRPGDDPAFIAAAQATGVAIAERGWTLVYGGGRNGLMGAVADAALGAGAPVIGVIPTGLVERERGHEGLTELHVVDTMHDRKRMMAERSDAFVTLPGGMGTFEELFEVWTWRQLRFHLKPLGLINVAGYYDPLLEFLESTRRHGFVPPLDYAMLHVDSDPARVLDSVGQTALGLGAAEAYQKI